MTTFVITGSSRGLGAAVAENLLISGYNIIGVSRNGNRNLQKYQCFMDITGTVSSETDVHKIFEDAKNKFNHIDGVVHAAAVMGPLGSIEQTDYKSWVNAVEINLQGTYNVLRESARIFRKQEFGHYVGISGGGATSPMPKMTAYAATKSAIVRLVESVARDFDQLENVTFNSVAPGIMKTEMIDEVIAAGPEIIGHEYFQKMVDFKQNGEDSVPKAVDLVCHLVSGKFPNISGRLISAVWDDWLNLQANKDYVKNLNIHTLRRVLDFEQ